MLRGATHAYDDWRQSQSMAPLASMTLLAAQLDFRDAGEMGVLLDEAQAALLEDMMAERGFLTGHQSHRPALDARSVEATSTAFQRVVVTRLRGMVGGKRQRHGTGAASLTAGLRRACAGGYAMTRYRD
jgi:hypothetical protein